MRVLLLWAIALLGCESKPKPSPAPAPPATNSSTTSTLAATETVPPPTPVVPKPPDYEDAKGTVRAEGGVYSLLVEGEKPICMPFDAPAEARVDGAKVRFTLYLDRDAMPTGCRPVQTLISMRAE